MPLSASTAPTRRSLLAWTLLASTMFVAPALAQAPDERRVTLADQSAVAVTIYNENLALVRDARRIALAQGRNRLAFVDVSGQLRAETALLAATGAGAAFELLEQNLEFDLLTPQKLLEKSVGKEVTIVKVHPMTAEETRFRARVLSTAQGVVLEINGEIHTSPPGRIVFDSVPPNLRARPTLTIDLVSRDAGTVPSELTYLSGGLSWRADYVALLTDKEDKFDLNGWVTLVNRSGTDYRNAKLQLVAGDPNIVRAALEREARDVGRAAPAVPKMRAEAVFDYHLYELERPTTIADNQQKQVALLAAANVAVAKQYRFVGQGHYYRSRFTAPGTVKAEVWLNFENEKRANLGLPLPRGVVRVYKRDSTGKAVFVGEDQINHTAEGETVRLKVGDAFDVSGVRTQTDFRVEVSGHIFESAYRFAFNNAKNEPVNVIVAEAIPGDWSMLAESHGHKRVTAGLVEWSIPVPAKGKAEMTYRVRTKF